MVKCEEKYCRNDAGLIIHPDNNPNVRKHICLDCWKALCKKQESEWNIIRGGCNGAKQIV